MPNDADSLRRADDGTPLYSDTVLASRRKLQVRTSIFAEPPRPGSGIRLGIYQSEAAFGPGAKKRNLARMADAIGHAKRFGVQLLAFPELYVSGYTLAPESARRVAEPAHGSSITRARQLARENQMGLIVPYAERVEEPKGPGRLYDAIAVIDENGVLLDSYRKTHLYAQQERDDWDSGTSDFPVHRIHGFPLGVLNCYECEFPELVRILALQGAKLVVGPTAADSYYRMPDGQRSRVPYPDVSRVQFPAHAFANNLFFAYCNHCGYEARAGDVWHYRGNSIIYGPHGDVVVAANHDQDTLLVADCVPAYYGRTHPEPGFFYLKDRRPELYARLVAREARFVDLTNRDLDEASDLGGEPFVYPDPPDEPDR